MPRRAPRQEYASRSYSCRYCSDVLPNKSALYTHIRGSPSCSQGHRAIPRSNRTPRSAVTSAAASPSSPVQPHPQVNDVEEDTEGLQCTICMVNKKVISAGCGHMTCSACSQRLSDCPTCRAPWVGLRRCFM
jgi:hypothetical protein